MKTILDNIIEKEHVGEVAPTAKDFKPGLDVRWCAGCGSYSILAQSQRIMPDLGVPKEKIAFISGIGCSGRFSYYMDVYALHGIHGRPIAIATGLKTSRPDLSVWVVTGDGDCMSIGGNHFIHACRRNVDINVLMFNNEVYSLTKGQYSPTSRPGQITKTSPLGVLEEPFNPSLLALGSGATFVARGYDKDAKQMQQLLERAAAHRGISFVEIYTNCVIFNDGAFDIFTRKESRDEHTVNLEHGKPLIFGEKKDKGIKLDGFKPIVVSISEGNYSVNDLLVYDEKDTTLSFIVAKMADDLELPRPMGIFQSIEKPSYNEKMENQLASEVEKRGEVSLETVLKGKDFWEIK